MAYLMNYGEISPPSPQYYNAIKNGYKANGLDISYLRAALERSVEYAQSQAQDEEDLEENDDFQMTLD